MEFETEEFLPAQIDEANALFRKNCEFVLGVAKLEQLPGDEFAEVAFAGRSNVGKSSIINAIFYQKKLAKTSNTPGRTQQLNYFLLNKQIYLVDLPGYGFAQAPDSVVKQWQKLIMAYLQGRASLKRVFLLIDSRHGLKKVDEQIMEMLDKAAVIYQIVLTKIDKISKKALDEIMQKTKLELSKHAAAYPKILATSSEKGIGLDQVRAEINSLIG